jgi:hypothetical protein
MFDKYQTLRNYHDKSHKFSFCDDLFATSIVIMMMFPELFVANTHYYNTDDFAYYIVINQDVEALCSFDPIQIKSIHLLAASMSHKEIGSDDKMLAAREKQCTAADALQFCSDIIANWDTLSDETVDAIAHQTIMKPDMTVSDALHGHLRR